MSDTPEPPHDVLAAEEFALPAPDPGLAESSAHDVLAAEEFALPAPDPGLAESSAHDVLAAEEFVVPAPDPRLAIGARPLVPPPDPYDPAGQEPAHDVLAAEEFAVPGTVSLHAAEPLAAATPAAPAARRLIPWVLAGVGVVVLTRRRRRG